MKLIGLAWKNLQRKGLRTLLTMLGIAIGVASVVLISTVGTLGTKAVNSELDSLGLNGISVSAQTNAPALDDTDLQMVRNVRQVEQAMPVLTQNGEIQTVDGQQQMMLWGIDAGAKQVLSVEILHGRMFTAADIRGKAAVCLLDEKLAEQLFGRENVVGKTVTLPLGTLCEQYTIVGITRAGSGILQSLAGDMVPLFAYLPYTTMQQAVGSSAIGQIAVKTEQGADVAQVSANISAALQQSRGSDEIKTENLAKQRDKLSNLLQIVTVVLSAIGAISLLVSGLSIMTVMLVSVGERTQEIGVKKAIGAGFFSIFCEFLAEALTICTIGSIIGAAAGLGVGFLAASSMGIQMTIEPRAVAVAILAAVISGVVFGLYPACKAARLKPVDALNCE